jgi:cell wall-associated NlpC family hydrolase
MPVPATSDLVALVGTPFAYGGRGPDTFDCWGLLKHLHALVGITLPDYRTPADRAHQAALIGAGLSLWEPCEKTPGASVAIRILGLVSHCGMVLPGDRFVHAWEGSGGVTIEPLSQWSRRIEGYYRYVGAR